MIVSANVKPYMLSRVYVVEADPMSGVFQASVLRVEVPVLAEKLESFGYLPDGTALFPGDYLVSDVRTGECWMERPDDFKRTSRRVQW